MLDEIQPCELCGKTDPPSDDEKYDDVYYPVRPGSRAMAMGYAQERLCGRCACAQFIGSYWDGTPDLRRTPIEQYYVITNAHATGPTEGRNVYVKRDDLWMGGKYGGGNAKLRGAEIRLRGLMDGGIQHVAVMDARTSRAGWGIADLCKVLGLSFTEFYGRFKRELIATPYDRNQFELVRKEDYTQMPYFQQKCWDAGATVYAMPASRVYPMYYKARKYCREHNIYLMPMGLQMTEAMLSVAGEVSSLPEDLIRPATLVCVVATGTMFAGLLLGLKGIPLYKGKPHIIGVYIGMTSGELKGRSSSNPETIIRNRISGLLPAGFEPPPFEIVQADREYYDEDNYPCPFPCDRWYDRKAWRWLCENINTLEEPVVFWNIG